MNPIKISIASLALCSLFTRSPVLADDCNDALIAESCACRSEARKVGEQGRSSEKTTRVSKTSRLKGPRAKNPIAAERSQAQR